MLGIGEIELGTEWARVIGRVRVFAQVAFVGQLWVGGSISNNGFTSIEFFDLGLGGQNSNNFGFLGGVLRAGVSF